MEDKKSQHPAPKQTNKNKESMRALVLPKVAPLTAHLLSGAGGIAHQKGHELQG